nr:PREDICTED: utrophin-like isoform X1 [Latimeria chalumnae]|eukprot:XP_006014214.1 PREDICTED: utrophin-like isoform X1 [Latimeria chalumnae]
MTSHLQSLGCGLYKLCIWGLGILCPVTLISMWPEQYDPTQSPQLSHDDTHSRIEQYANRLAHMERTNGSLFTDSSSTTGSV